MIWSSDSTKWNQRINPPELFYDTFLANCQCLNSLFLFLFQFLLFSALKQYWFFFLFSPFSSDYFLCFTFNFLYLLSSLLFKIGYYNTPPIISQPILLITQITNLLTICYIFFLFFGLSFVHLYYHVITNSFFFKNKSF